MSEMKPILKEGEKEHIVLVHDESTINDNDYQHDFWLKADEHVLKKKTRGRLQMTSGYICKRYGNLALTDELVNENTKLPEVQRLAVTDSCVTICPSGRQGGDNYWNMDQMIAQVS
jgi:hypothetical protein